MLQEKEEEGDGDRHNHIHKKQKIHENNMDEISDIPEPIVHQIMSYLNVSEITRISTLSKRFFSIWSSYPVIVFDEKKFARTLQGRLGKDTIIDLFLDHIYSSVHRRRIDRVLSEFRVKANLSGTYTVDERFDSVIAIVLVNGVRCMDLDFGHSARYLFPIAIASNCITVLRLTGFTLEPSNIIQGCPSLGVVSIKSCVILQDIDFSSKTLTDMEFDNCDVSSIKINAPNLHSFSYGGLYMAVNPKPCSIDVSQCQNIAYMKLTNVVNGHWIEDLVYTLSNLETLILVSCQNIERIKIWNEKLERFDVVDCRVLASIELSSKSLKSFRYKGVNNFACDISFIASKLIKDLSIEGLGISDQWLESQIAKLHCLETLRLKECNSLTNIKVFHDMLQILEFHRCLNLVEADIDTPRLITFEYHGKLIKFSKMVSGGDCAATLDMESSVTYNDDQFCRWRDLLSYFGYFKPLKFCTFQKQLLMIPERLRDNLVQPLYDLQHLDIQIQTLNKINEIDTDLVDSLLWLSPLPRTIHISSGSHFQMIIEFAYYLTIERKEDKNPLCCINKPIKCWRHRLKTVKIRSNDAFPESDLMKLKKYFTTSAKIEDSCCFISTGLD